MILDMEEKGLNVKSMDIIKRAASAHCLLDLKNQIESQRHLAIHRVRNTFEENNIQLFCGSWTDRLIFYSRFYRS
jgi:hypothetical protein